MDLFNFSLCKGTGGAGELTQLLHTLAALAEHPGSYSLHLMDAQTYMLAKHSAKPQKMPDCTSGLGIVNRNPLEVSRQSQESCGACHVHV